MPLKDNDHEKLDFLKLPGEKEKRIKSIEPQLSYFINPYLLKLKEKLNFIPNLFFPDGLPLEDFYVELSVMRNTPQYLRVMAELARKDRFDPIEYSNYRYRFQEEQKLKIKDILEYGDSWRVIMGDPGAGKTTLIDYIVYLIVNEKIPKYKIPFVVRLRDYAVHRTLGSSPKNLIEYAMENLISSQDVLEKKDVLRYLRHLSGNKRENVIFLIDGFDEISSNKEVCQLVEKGLEELSWDFSYILTSRRAGFLADLRVNKTYEIIGLSDPLIMELAGKLFKICGMTGKGGVSTFIETIFINPSLHMMARNPFLLTLLVILHTTYNGLKKRRADVYQDALELLKDELRKKYKDNNLFTFEESKTLADFALFLFKGMENRQFPRLIFQRNDFETFCQQENRDETLLHQVFLKSRILNQWPGDRSFYFTHLTFQEYLTAKALSQKPGALQILEPHFYNPQWKEALKFYAAILASKYKNARNRNNPMSEFLQAYIARIDLFGILYAELAIILGEAGITDITGYFTFDLKQILLENYFKSGQLNRVFAQAMRTWNPGYFTDIAIEFITKSLVRPAGSGTINAYDETLNYIQLLGEISDRKGLDYLFQLLTDEKTPEKIADKISLFLGMSNNYFIFKQIKKLLSDAQSSPCKESQENSQSLDGPVMSKFLLLRLLNTISRSEDDQYYPLVKTFIHDPDAEIAETAIRCCLEIRAFDFLKLLESWCSNTGNRRNIFTVIGSIHHLPSQKTTEILFRLLETYDGDEEIMEEIMDRFIEFDVPLLRPLPAAYFEELIKGNYDEYLKTHAVLVRGKLGMGGLERENFLFHLLQNPETPESLKISALEAISKFGLVTYDFRQCYQQISPLLEGPQVSGTFFDNALATLGQVLKVNVMNRDRDAATHEYETKFIDQLLEYITRYSELIGSTAAYWLGQIGHPSILPRLLHLLENPESIPTSVLSSIIEAVGMFTEKHTSAILLQYLSDEPLEKLGIPEEDREMIRQTTAEALVKTDFTTLIPLRDTSPYLEALSDFALENGFLVFEDFSVDPVGTIIPHGGKDKDEVYLETINDTSDTLNKDKMSEEKILPGKILILSANPRDPMRDLRLDEEIRDIEEALKPAIRRKEVELIIKLGVRNKDLRREIAEIKPYILHFAGHGTQDGLIVLDEIGFGSVTSNEAISRLLELSAPYMELKCIIFDACNTEKLATAVSKHIMYSVGMKGEIDDEAAVHFSMGFYEALGDGKSIEDAFKFGCLAIQQEFPDESYHLIPVLKKRKTN